MLKLDLTRLGSAERFQALCTRLARRAFPEAYPMAFGSWDGGRDVVHLMRMRDDALVHEAVWQAKYTTRLDATTKRSIAESIARLQGLSHVEVRRWILCLPVDPSGTFMDWLAAQIPTNWEHEVWGASIMLEKLEANPDLVETFFYSAYEELRRYFAVEKLELVRLSLDAGCEWKQPDPEVLGFASHDTVSPDLIIDVIVRNSGRVDGVLLAVEAQVFDRCINPHGLPGDGLLFPQITYEVSINHGQPGTYRTDCEPPLVVRAAGVERFKVRLRDTGYAWYGSVAITLDFGGQKRLRLPCLRLYT